MSGYGIDRFVTVPSAPISSETDRRFRLAQWRTVAMVAIMVLQFPVGPHLEGQTRDQEAAARLDERAAQAYAEGTTASLQLAIARWTRALSLFQRVRDRVAVGKTLNNIGWSHHLLGDSDVALDYLERAVPIRRDAGDREGELVTLVNLGAVYFEVLRPDPALTHLVAAVSLSRGMPDRSTESLALSTESLALRMIGKVHDSQGRLDSAMVYYRRALSIHRVTDDLTQQSRTLNDIGLLLDVLGRPDSAIASYREALAIERRLADSLGVGVTLNNIGLWHANRGRPDSALAYHRRALAILDPFGALGEVGVTLMNIGHVFRTSDQLDSALTYFGEALEVLQQTTERGSIALVLVSLGSVYDARDAHDVALNYYRQALPISREIGAFQLEPTILNAIGNSHWKAGRSDSAIAYVRMAMGIAREVGDRATEAYLLTNLGDFDRAAENTFSAELKYQRALELARDIGDAELQGNLHRRLGLLSRRTPNEAVAHYESAAAAIASVRAHTGDDQRRLGFAERYEDLFQLWSLAWLGRSREVGAQDAALGALAAAERGRAQALQDLLGQASSVSGPGADMVAQGRSLVREAVASGVTVLYYLIARVPGRTFERPSISQLMFRDAPPPRRLGRDETDTLVIWLARPSGSVAVHRRALSRDSLSNLITYAGNLLRRGGPVDTPNRALASLLLPGEVLNSLPGSGEILIVPHGPLGMVPFAALPIDEAGTALGNRYAVRYSPSLATLAGLQGQAEGARRDRRGAFRSALVVGDPTPPQGVLLNGETLRLPSLRGARAEADSVARQLGAQPLKGARATEAAVRRRWATAPLIHLATHGWAFSSDALVGQSGFALAGGGGHDGLLTVNDLLRDPTLRLRAELVVLSACETGLGDVRQSEGTVGLQRAFMARGARSVLVSLWRVSDEATTLLMDRFYKHWLGDVDRPSKAEALKRAQTDVRATAGFQHPRYWAAFQLVGAN